MLIKGIQGQSECLFNLYKTLYFYDLNTFLMKKILFLLTLATSFCFAQNNSVPLRCATNLNVASPILTDVDLPNFTPYRRTGLPGNATRNSNLGPISTTSLTEYVIGNTLYDLQSNRGPARRIVNNDDGTISAAWTFSANQFGYPDRGTGYNYYDGTSWGPIPFTRIENIKTGTTNISVSGGKEYTLAHSLAGTGVLLSRPKGSGAWTTYTPVGGTPPGYDAWFRLASGGPNGNTIHAIVNPQSTGVNPIGPLTYSRSQDGGATWDIQHIVLPGCGPSFYRGVIDENYSIDCSGNTLVIATCNLMMDVVMWKSTDNGTTWTKTIIEAAPIAAYNTATDYAPLISDLNGDGIADTINSNAGDINVTLDNTGLVHATWSKMRCLDNQTTAGTSITIFPLTSGIMYWNESMSIPAEVAGLVDQNGDGVFTLPPQPFVPAAPDLPFGRYGNGGLTIHPQIGLDNSNNVFIVYSAVSEITDYINYHAALRHIFLTYSSNMGSTWSPPEDLVPSAALGGDGEYQECVWPSIAKRNGAKVHIVYQRDPCPEYFVNNTSVFGPQNTTTNDIIYVAWNNASPQVSISASGPTTFCQGGNVTLTATGGSGPYLWSNGATTQSINVTTAGTYSCNINGAIPLSITITILNPVPATPTITANGPLTFCSGGSVVLTSSSPTGNTWSNGSTTQSITVTNAGNYYVTVSNGTCIATSTQKTVVVNPTPATPTISITGPVAFCDVDSVILTSNIASNIVWSNSATTQSIVVHSTGNYFVTTNNGLCSASSIPIAINVYVTPPKPIITANGPTSFCTNGTNFITLSTSSSYLLNWFKLGTGITGNTTSSINVYSSGMYYVMATNYSGNAPTCHTKSDTIVITTYGYPTITTSPISQAVSPTSNVQFSTSSNSTGVTFQWQENNGTGFTNITNGGQYAGATSATLTVANVIKSQNNYQYRCVISNGFCDTISNAATLTVFCLAPAVNLSGSNTFCQGTPVNLFAANGSGYTYQWYRNGSVIAGATAANYAATTAGNYSVRIDSGGCYGVSPAQNVSFYSLPNVGISNSTGTVVCSGSPVTLNGTGALSYTWNNGVVNNTTFYPTSTNTYQVVGTDINGCTNVSGTTISVNGLPSVQSIIGNPSIVPFQNYVYAVNSTPGITLNWLIQGGAIVTGQGTNNVNVIWGSNGPYLLQLVQSNANGCSDISSLAVINSNCSITYTVQQVGTAPYCQGDSITLSVATAPGTQFQWLLNGAPINNAIATSVTATQSGVYQVQMTQAGCTALSNGNSITFLQAPATPVITASGAGSGCLGGTQSLSCPAGYASYLWNNGTTNASTIANNSGNYVVTVTGANGCEATSAPYFVNLSLLSSADICLVSVDDVTNKNVVIWEKPVLTGVDSFYVYKESTSSNVYTKIGSVAANVFSTFTDINSNPLQRADHYKISILDTCGFESSPSTIHKTIHLSINQGVGNTYNLIWDAYEGFVFGTYYILRGTTPNNLVTIDSIQSNLLSYTDLNPPAGNVYYAIEVRKAIQCNPTARTSSLGYASSRSNIKDNTLSSLNDYTDPFNSFTIVPNPATENTSVNINLSNSSLTNISVFDLTGRLVQILNNSTLTAGSHSFTWDLNENNAKAKAGIYLIKVAANGYTQTKRVVVL
jgi:hypothetical protein